MADKPRVVAPPPVSPSADDRAVQSTAPAVVQQMASTPPVQPEPYTSSRSKELGSASAEITQIKEVPGAAAIEQEPIPPEVQAWMEKVGSVGGEPVLNNLPAVQVSASTAPSAKPSGKPLFVLPLGETDYKAGEKAGINDSLHWLAAWCQRIIKQLKGEVAYKQA